MVEQPSVYPEITKNRQGHPKGEWTGMGMEGWNGEAEDKVPAMIALTPITSCVGRS